MNDTQPLNATTRIDYTQDTLFGPMTKHADCAASLLEDAPGHLTVHVFAPLPDDLQHAHTLVLTLQGRRVSGLVRDKRRLADGGLRLTLELQ